MEDVVAAQEKQCVDAWAVVGASASCDACVRMQLANAASVAQMLESMEDVWWVRVVGTAEHTEPAGRRRAPKACLTRSAAAGCAGTCAGTSCA